MHKTRGSYVSLKHLDPRKIYDRGHIFLQYIFLMLFFVLVGAILGKILFEFHVFVWIGVFGLSIFFAIFAQWLRSH